VLAGPVLAGPVLAGPVLAGPVLAGPVLAGEMLAAGEVAVVGGGAGLVVRAGVVLGTGGRWVDLADPPEVSRAMMVARMPTTASTAMAPIPRRRRAQGRPAGRSVLGSGRVDSSGLVAVATAGPATSGDVLDKAAVISVADRNRSAGSFFRHRSMASAMAVSTSGRTTLRGAGGVDAAMVAHAPWWGAWMGFRPVSAS
jgi:hypothetical protein